MGRKAPHMYADRSRASPANTWCRRHPCHPPQAPACRQPPHTGKRPRPPHTGKQAPHTPEPLTGKLTTGPA
ncbi:MAG: hypothetical protein QW069_03195, partial [Candidatus Caldarchaeum sp.]